MRLANRHSRTLSRRQREQFIMEALQPRTLLSTWVVPYTSNGATNGTNLANILSGVTQQGGSSLQLGDTIVLQAGVSWIATGSGGFVLPDLTVGTGVVTIESSDMAALPTTERVGPAQSADMPQMETKTGNGAVFSTATSAHDFTLEGLEMLPTANTVIVLDLLRLGSGTQTLVSQVPMNFIVDRCYIHGLDPTSTSAEGTAVRGITLNSANTTVENCYISDIHNTSADANAIGGWNGTGGYTITNNFLEATGENLFFGGADTLLTIANGNSQNYDPTNINITKNYLFKPLTWDPWDPSLNLPTGVHYDVKNLFEIKHATFVTFDQNLLQNCWVGADQVGVAVVLGPKDSTGTNTWALVHDISVTNNVIENVGEGFNLGFSSTTTDTGYTSLPMYDVTIQNNLVESVNGTPSLGEGLGIEMGAETAPGYNVTIDHNTFFSTHNFLNLNPPTTHPSIVSSGFVFTNNVVDYGQYGLYSSIGQGITALNTLCPGWTFSNNLINGIGTNSTSLYPGNFFPATEDAVGFLDTPGDEFGLLTSSPYYADGTSGSVPGVNMSALSGVTDFVAVDSTLQNYYKFDETSGTTATDSGLGTHHNGVLSNASIRTTTAEMNSGIALTGGASGSVAVTSFSTTSAFTFSAWINPTSNTGNSGYIASTTGTGNSAFAFSIDSSGNLRVTVGATTLTDTSFNYYTTGTGGNSGLWYLVSATYDPSGAHPVLTLYRNGAAVASNTSAGAYTAGSTTLYIGGNQGSITCFKGTIDEVRYYSSALDGTINAAISPVSAVTQMQQLYNGFAPIIDSISGPKFGTQAGTSINLGVTAVSHATSSLGGNHAPTSLVFNWSIISGPLGTGFSLNDSNAAQQSTLTFSSAGAYVLQLTVTDLNGLGASTTIDYPLVVVQTPQDVTITPPSLTIGTGGQQTFTGFLGTGLDQFGNPLTSSTWTWGVTAASGSTNGSLSTTTGTGPTVYTAPATAGTNTLALKYTDTTSGTPAAIATAVITIGGGAPNAPTNLVATPGTSGIGLTWTDNSTNETGFHVWRSTDNSNWGSYLVTLGSGSVLYNDSSAAAGTAYYYKVTSYNGSGDSSVTLGQNDITCAVATVIAYEGFNYATGHWSGGNSGVGFASNWTDSGSTNANIIAGSLTYSSAGHALTTSANELQLADADKATGTLASNVAASGSTLWVGYEFSVNPGTGSYLVAQLDVGPLTNQLRLGSSTSNKLQATALVGGTLYTMTSSTATLANTTYFMVYEIQYLTTGDVITQYINPTPGVTPTTNNGTLTLPATAQLTSTNSIDVWSDAGTTIGTFDEIRLGVSYASVAPDPLIDLPAPRTSPLPRTASNLFTPLPDVSIDPLFTPILALLDSSNDVRFTPFLATSSITTAALKAQIVPATQTYDAYADQDSSPSDIYTLDAGDSLFIQMPHR